MSYFVRLLGLLLCVLAGFLPVVAQAQRELTSFTSNGIDVTVTSAYTEVPSSGYLPVSVRVLNATGGAFSAPFRSRTETYTGSSGRTSSFTQSIQLGVPSGQARTFELLVPLSNSLQGYGGTTVRMTFLRDFPTHGTGYNAAFILATDQGFGLQANQITNDARGKSPSHVHNSPKISSLKPDFLSEDSRAYFGVTELWMRPHDWRSLRPAQSLAIQDWVLRGGQLVVWSAEPDAALSEEWVKLGARNTSSVGDNALQTSKRMMYGFGNVSFRSWSGGEPDGVKAATSYFADRFVARTADELQNGTAAQLDAPYTDWQLLRTTKKLRVNLPLTLLFVVAFAILVGPVNLFIFAKGSRRYRMFWTTPLLSLGASVLLGLLIVVVDGFGATGKRALLVSLSGQNRASFFQEQVVRSGVLTNRTFSAPGAVVQPLRVVGSRELQGEFAQADGLYEGDWFTSRSLCGLYLETTTAFRGKIEIANRKEFEMGNGEVPPQIISSLGVVLDALEFVDAQGRIWEGANLKTGEKSTLKQSKDGRVLQNKMAEFLGPANNQLVRRMIGANNVFYAVASGPGPFTETLPSIRWEEQKIAFTGVVE